MDLGIAKVSGEPIREDALFSGQVCRVGNWRLTASKVHNAFSSRIPVTYLPEIWERIKTHMPGLRWVALDHIYELVETWLHVARQNFELQSPSSPIPKLYGNVRGVVSTVNLMSNKG
jgi:hypothetical protein